MILVLHCTIFILTFTSITYSDSYFQIVSHTALRSSDSDIRIEGIRSEIDCARHLLVCRTSCFASYLERGSCYLSQSANNPLFIWLRNISFQKRDSWKTIFVQKDIDNCPPQPLLLWILDRRHKFKNLGYISPPLPPVMDGAFPDTFHQKCRGKTVAKFPSLLLFRDLAISPLSLQTFSVYFKINIKDKFEVLELKDKDKKTILKVSGGARGLRIHCQKPKNPLFTRTAISPNKWHSVMITFESGSLTNVFIGDNYNSGNNKRLCLNKTAIISFYSLGSMAPATEKPFGLTCVGVFEEKLSRDQMKNIEAICPWLCILSDYNLCLCVMVTWMDCIQHSFLFKWIQGVSCDVWKNNDTSMIIMIIICSYITPLNNSIGPTNYIQSVPNYLWKIKLRS